MNGWIIKTVVGKSITIIGTPEEIGDSLPRKLTPEETMTMFYDQERMAEIIRSEIDKGHLKKNRQVTIEVYDSTGKCYKAKSKETADDLAKVYLGTP